MNHDFASPDRIEGYPSFVRRDPVSADFNWWAPHRTGDPALDYCVGISHFGAALRLIDALRDPSSADYYAALIVSGVNPRDLLFNILWAMPSIGPIERGFLSALAKKAFVGTSPPPAYQDEEERYAYNCLEVARATSWPELLDEELQRVIGQGFDDGADSFARVICSAAAAGALH